MVSAGRVFALIDERTYEPLQEDGQTKVKEGNIRFEHVCFSYDGNIRFWMTFLSLLTRVKLLPL